MKEVDNRSRERVAFEIEAVFTHLGKSYQCRCENVSMGGVLLESQEQFPVGLAGSVAILLRSGSQKLEVKGQCHIVRVAQGDDGVNEYGFEFDLLDPESSITLFNMIKYQKA